MSDASRTARIPVTPPMSNISREIASAWSPLRHTLFRAVWISSVVSNIGTWMQDVGAAWLMTSLSSSPLMVALLQTATSLPFFLLALPAGALADVIDRRRLLLFTQGWMLAAAAGLGVMTIGGATTPWILLAFSFALGIGTAMSMPVWQATIPELVSQDELPAAVTLGGVGFNVARAIGPAFGGFIVAAAGSGAVFFLNAASFIGVILVLSRWRRPASERVLPPEHVTGAIRAGVRYVRHAQELRAVLVRTCVFILCSSAVWALLPLLARRVLGINALAYGVLLGFLGLGSVVCASILPRMRQHLSVDLLVGGATLLFAMATVSLAYFHHYGVLCGVMAVGGIAWMALMSSFNVAAQTAAPAWVRARVLSVYLLVFMGGMAAGSVLWGAVATRTGIPLALVIAAGGLVVGLGVAPRYRLQGAQQLDLTPSMHWPEPTVVIEPHPDQGPVLVMLEYRIDPERSRDFTLAMQAMKRARQRGGAIRWGLFRDAADASRYVESFVVESWAEHLRQHERVTIADRAAEDYVRVFHLGENPPIVSHFIHASPGVHRQLTPSRSGEN